MADALSHDYYDGLKLPARTLRALDRTDAMSPELRACVQEFGSEIVHTVMSCGIEDAAKIRFLVHSIWMGARQPAQRNTISRSRSPVLDSLDWILLQANAGVTAATLLRILWSNGMVVVPKEPSTVMVDASVDAVAHMGLVSKKEKHRGRLRAAINASTKRLWPHLITGTPALETPTHTTRKKNTTRSALAQQAKGEGEGGGDEHL